MSEANRRLPWPPAAAERWLLVGTRYPDLRAAALAPARTAGWKSATLLSRVLFFLLGLGAAGATLGIFAALGRDNVTLVLAGVALLIAAELLIGVRRTVSSGFEEALWVAGAVCLAVGLLDSFDGSSGLEGAVAAALLLAGGRLRNPFVVTLGAVAVSVALALERDSGLLAGNLRSGLAASWCYLVATAALVAGGRTYARPSTDRILHWLVVVLPVAGWGWLQGNGGGPLTLESVSVAALVPVLLPLLFGIVAGVTGATRRTHAPLIALLACLGCVAVQLREFTGLELHWRLMLWGTLGLIVAIALERWLRTPRAGITSRNLDENLAALDLAQYAGAAATAAGPGAPPAGAPAYQGDGGRFGGGGASGRY